MSGMGGRVSFAQRDGGSAAKDSPLKRYVRIARRFFFVISMATVARRGACELAGAVEAHGPWAEGARAVGRQPCSGRRGRQILCGFVEFVRISKSRARVFDDG
jgi:hypothetical protein